MQNNFEAILRKNENFFCSNVEKEKSIITVSKQLFQNEFRIAMVKKTNLTFMSMGFFKALNSKKGNILSSHPSCLIHDSTPRIIDCPKVIAPLKY